MLKLFHSPDSRSTRIIWLLEELGEPYEIVHVDIPRASGRGAPDPANPHPDRRVPALQHDASLVTECAAIALYLTDTFPAAGLGPVAGHPGRAAYLTWLAFYAGEIEPDFKVWRRNGLDKDPLQVARRDHERVQRRVAAALSAEPWLLGDAVSAADILVSGPFEWIRAFGPPEPQIDGWLARLAARPGARRAAELDQPPARPV
jgi:glutathione S-transferase